MSRKLLLVADSHVTPGQPGEAEFFQMLEAVEQTTLDVVFLGDNLDLWICAAPRYETTVHRRFLDWCRREKAVRRVVLTEGNHEFYLCRHHADCFSLCTTGLFRMHGMTFLHGDMAHGFFSFHRFFRWFAKNAFGDFIMRYLPGGVPFARFMKKMLAHKRRPNEQLPMKDIEAWMQQEAGRFGTKHILLGHFHHYVEKCLPRGPHYCILPAWKDLQEVALLDTETGNVTVGPWKTILSGGRN